jgi:hypothetical protein
MSLVKNATAAGRRLAELRDSEVSWREASEDVRAAYRWWRECALRDRALAFELYRAALDHEQRAARIQSDSARRVRAVRS